MLKRVITAIVLVGLVVGLLYAGTINYIALDVLIMLFTFIGAYEMYRSFKKSGYLNSWIPLLALVIGIYPLWYFTGYKGILIILSVSVMLSLAIFTFTSKMEIKDLMATVFTLIYPTIMMSLAFALSREFACGGIFAISFGVFLPVFSDTFAYLVGSTMGKRKLCPTISPKKTIAGAVGGVLGSVICAVVFYLLFDWSGVISAGYNKFTDNTAVAVVVYLAIGLIGGVLAEIGDLSASRIKRSIGIKDFGNIFPGHGGALDRLDSIIFTLAELFIAFVIMY